MKRAPVSNLPGLLSRVLAMGAALYFSIKTNSYGNYIGWHPRKCLRQGKSGLIEPGTHTVDSLAYVRVFLKMVAQTTGCG